MIKEVRYITFPGETEPREIVDTTARSGNLLASEAAGEAKKNAAKALKEIEEKIVYIDEQLEDFRKAIENIGDVGDVNTLAAQVSDLETAAAGLLNRIDGISALYDTLNSEKQGKLSATNPLPVTSGGTGSYDPENARKNLGLGAAAVTNQNNKLSFSLDEVNAKLTITLTNKDGQQINSGDIQDWR